MPVLLHRAVKLPVRVTLDGSRVRAVTLLKSAKSQRLPVALAKQLEQYFAGRKTVFRVPLDLTAGTKFQQNVWRALQKIPHGETRSYAWVARKIGKPAAVRAVGTACGANPIPVIIPCHRVLRSDGGLGGFSAGLGWKKRLLALERCR